MKVEYIVPVEWIKGILAGQFYCRQYRGQNIIQRRPDRSGHVKTPAEEANQKRFAEQYAGKHKKQ